MRFFLSIAILLWVSVIKTASSQTPSTIQGPILASSPSISALPEDCLSPVDWHDIIFITAVPIAAGFGLLLLLACLQDFRQAYKSNRSCRPAPRPTIRGSRAIKERSYVIDVDYAGRSLWGSFLRWCVTHKSSGAIKNPCLVRLQGTFAFSDWLSFDLILGLNSEKKTVTTPCSIGKLVAVETKYYPSESDGLNSRQLPSSNIGACLQGLINRACDIEIKTIQVTDAKTKLNYTSGCGPSSGGISSDQRFTTILPLLSTTQLSSRVNYVAYYLKHGSLWTSTFIPWRGGNFTGARHITCLFACISYTMVAVQVMSEPLLEPSLEGFVVVSPMDFNITMGMMIKAMGVGAVLFPFLILMEVLSWATPPIWSLFDRPDKFPFDQHGNSVSGSAQTRSDNENDDNWKSADEGLTQYCHWPANNGHGIFDRSSLIDDTQDTCDDDIRCSACSDTHTEMNDTSNSKSDIKPTLTSSNDPAVTLSESICAVNMLECQHKFARYKCPVCKQATGTGSMDYNPGASCPGELTPVRCELYGYGGLTCPRYAYSNSRHDSDDSTSNTLTNVTPLANFARSTSNDSLSSLSCSDCSVSTSISDSSSCIFESAPYITQRAIEDTAQDDDSLNYVEKHQTAPSLPSSKEHSQHSPYSILRAISTSGLTDDQCKNIDKKEAGDGRQATKCHGKQCEMKQEDTNATVGFKEYSAALNDANINSAKVLRTKNYINRFTDMGKGRVISLPNLDAILPKDKLKTKQLPDIKSNLSTPGFKPESNMDRIKKETTSDCIIDLPMAFEMPSVTIQSSSSHKLFFFNIRKWLGGLRSKPKVDVGDNYKLEVMEHDAAAIKTSDENTCPSSQHEDEVQMNKAGDHLQGSIFQSTSRMIEYQSEVISLASSGSWSSVPSYEDFIERQVMDANITNMNNSNQVTIIEMEPCDQPSPSLPVTTDSEAVLSIETSVWSSTSIINLAKPSESATIAKTLDDLVNDNQGMKEDGATTTTKNTSCFLPILVAIGHILLIASCVLAVLWSVSSIHGLCWSAFWEWIATSIIAVLFEAVILDTIKAIIMTVMKMRRHREPATPQPQPLIY